MTEPEPPISRQAPGLFGKIRSVTGGWCCSCHRPALVAVLYSAANGNCSPGREMMIRYGIALGLLLVAALIDIRFWYRAAYPIYGCRLLLVAVDLKGARDGRAALARLGRSRCSRPS